MGFLDRLIESKAERIEREKREAQMVLTQQSIEAEKMRYGGFTLSVAVAYYKACVDANILEIVSAANSQRALLLAKSRSSFNIEDIDNKFEEMFSIGLEATNEAKRAEQYEQNRKLKEEDRKRANSERDRANQSPRQKLQHNILEALNNAEKELRSIESLDAYYENREIDMAYSKRLEAAMHHEKEKDWSISAGIASGIAGGGFGLAVAGEIIADNAAKRARNAEREKQAQLTPEEISKSREMLREHNRMKAEPKMRIGELKRKLEATEIRLIDESQPIDDLFSKLEFDGIRLSSTISDSVEVFARVRMKQGLSIKMVDDLDGLIDGVMLARIRYEENEVGIAYLVTPTDGISDAGWHYLKGICPDTDSGRNYTVSIEPYKLWVLEKIDPNAQKSTMAEKIRKQFEQNGGKITIRDGTTSIADNAFAYLLASRSVTSITVPSGVTSIGKSAFSTCYELEEVILPDTLTIIGESAFSGCNSLRNVTIPDSVTSIGELAFFGCTALTSATISGGLTSIGKSVFSNCSALDNVTIND